MMRREGGRVVIELSHNQWVELLLMIGEAAGARAARGGDTTTCRLILEAISSPSSDEPKV